MPGYGQFCPVAKAMEILDERWTLLVVRELLAGSTRFNELRRGNPRMSPALLSKRLGTLERAGLVRREMVDGHASYSLTPSGEDLREVVMALGVWGTRWIGELGDEDLDPHLLMWDIKRHVPAEEWPRERTVVGVRFDDVPAWVSAWWLVTSEGEVDVCDFDPGFEKVATVRTSLRTLTAVWRGDRSWTQAHQVGRTRGRGAGRGPACPASLGGAGRLRRGAPDGGIGRLSGRLIRLPPPLTSVAFLRNLNLGQRRSHSPTRPQLLEAFAQAGAAVSGLLPDERHGDLRARPAITSTPRRAGGRPAHAGLRVRRHGGHPAGRLGARARPRRRAQPCGGVVLRRPRALPRAVALGAPRAADSSWSAQTAGTPCRSTTLRAAAVPPGCWRTGWE